MRNKVRWLAVVILLGGAEACASSPCGIYARIDEVSVGPNQDQPTWILIKGDFLVVKTSRRHEGPARGYMCFALDKGKHKEKCLIEWDDLKKLAEEKGKGKAYVAFGSAFSEPFQDSPDVRATAEQAQQNQFPYPVHHGLTRMRIPSQQESGDQRDRNPVIVLHEFQTKKDGASR